MSNSTSSPYTTTTPPRRTHRKRVSAAHLSSDTTFSLPTYQSQQIRLPQDLLASPTPSDQPPDYPGSVDSDSAEEADEDTDTEPNTTSSPSRLRFPPAGSKKRSGKSLTSSSDDYLDKLLERSVHALEISNSLLQQSSMTPHQLTRGASGSQAPAMLSRRGSTGSAQESNGSRSRTRRSRFLNRALPDPIEDAVEDSDDTNRSPFWPTDTDRRDKWAQDMDELSRDVEGLFGNGGGMTASISLPASSPITTTSRQQQGARRRPSLDLHAAMSSTAPSHLRLDQLNRSSLIAPPPRALTLYVASNDASERDKITLPSTLGLRGTGAVHELHQPSRAAEMLAALSSPNPALSSQQPTRLPFLMRSRTVAGGERPSPSSRGRGGLRLRPSASPHSQTSSRPPSATRSDSHLVPGPVSRSRSQTPKPLALWNPTPIPNLQRRMTPPLEESSSSSEDFTAKQTMSALRKILDDHPDPVTLLLAKPPAFMPRTPPPAPQVFTSTATASISRLFTKGTHRAGSPTPRHSALKGTSVPTTPITSEGSWLRVGSASASGVSTPKRISFARLPEPHSAKNSAFKLNRERARRSKPRSRSSTSARVIKANEEAEAESESWWVKWLVGPSATGNTRGMEKMEERMGRGGSRMGFASGGTDEWAI